MSVDIIKVKVSNGRGAEGLVTLSWKKLERDIERYQSRCVGKAAIEGFIKANGITTSKDPRFVAWVATWERCGMDGCRVEPDGECPQGWPSRLVAADLAERRSVRGGS